MYSLFYAVEPSIPNLTSQEKTASGMCTYARNAFAPKVVAKVQKKY